MDSTALILPLVALLIGLAIGLAIGWARAKQLVQDRESMVNSFKALSAQALAEATESVDKTASHRLAETNAALAPVKETLAALHNQLSDVSVQRERLGAQLSEQVRAVAQNSENLRRETNALSTVLRKPQVRGHWGELQLRRVVELAGMVNHVDFYEQATSQNDQGQIRPDMKVMLGANRFIYVDSKVPLTSYLDAELTNDVDTRAALLNQFGENVKAHVSQLGNKNYWQASSNSPEFVVLFLPSESLAAQALNQKPDLIEYAASKNVVLACPTTLIGLLRAVSYGWKQAALADNAQQIFEYGRELYDRLGVLSEHFNKLGRALTTSVASYNQAIGSLESRVLVTARKFQDMKLADNPLDSPTQVDLNVRQLSSADEPF
uniref:DNA recombination protein RmuC n=1 Tax=Vaginimicrobium propionicum TaxID=1871034 RepID=UPI000970BAB4|nr:DNA recombination protein RmuC [Vaginimicrobium propionicum]